MALTNGQLILDLVRMFRKVGENTSRLLVSLNYRNERTLELEEGRWEIFTKKNFTFPYFLKATNTTTNRFYAVFRGASDFAVGGSYESIEELEENLRYLAREFLRRPRKWMGIPLALTSENAQDYGYVRGLLIGLALMIADIGVAVAFESRNAVFYSIIEYTQQVAALDRGLAIIIGIAASGFYFTTLLILLPVFLGNWAVGRARKLEQARVARLPEVFLDYEYGEEAERALEEEYRGILEELRKEAMYAEVRKVCPAMGKIDFESIYLRLKEGFFSAETLREFLGQIRSMDPALDPEQLLDTIVRFQKAAPEVEFKFRTDEPATSES